MEPPAPPMEPQAPKPGATFENPFRRPCLFIVTDFKTISRGASYVFDCGKNLGTHECLRATLETVGSHFHKSYVTNNASALSFANLRTKEP